MAKIKPTHHAVFIVVLLRDSSFLDMMRYDNCTPGSEAESSRIESVLRDGAKQWVVLRRFVGAGNDPMPTWNRWASFGIKCVQESYENYYDARRMADAQT